jgi:iron transport multicopper oxidase
MKYSFRAFPYGSSFWHAHFHSENADGTYGPFIVEEPQGQFPHHYDEERVIILTDHYDLSSWQETIVNLAQILANVKANKIAPDEEPDRGLLCVYDEQQSPASPSCSSTSDGDGFNMNFEPGKTYRLRLICTAQIQAFLFSIDEHEMQLAALDMSPVSGGQWVKSVQLLVRFSWLRYFIISRAL